MAFNKRPGRGMMQNNNRGGYGGNRAPRLPDGRYEVRFLIPSRAASVIIGKGGERIQRLRHECNARLTIPDNKGPERIFTVDTVLENIEKIWKDCFADLKDYMSDSGPDSFNNDLDLRFLCHSSLAGNVIGKGGDKVKSLRLKYNLSIVKVYPNPAPMSTDRVIQIYGPIDQVFQCFREIQDSLHNLQMKGPVEFYNAENSDESLAPTYGGWGRDRSSGDYSRRQGGGGGNMLPPPPGSIPVGGSMPTPLMNLVPERGGMQPNPRFGEQHPRFAGDGIPPPNNPRFNNEGMPPNTRFNSQFGGGMRGARNDGFRGGEMGFDGRSMERGMPPMRRGDMRKRDNSDEVDQVGGMKRFRPMMGQEIKAPMQQRIRVSVPRSCVEYIKGSNGERVWNIMNDSGADISFDDMDRVSPDAVITLSGTKDQIDGAQFLLQICVKKCLLNL